MSKLLPSMYKLKQHWLNCGVGGCKICGYIANAKELLMLDPEYQKSIKGY